MRRVFVITPVLNEEPNMHALMQSYKALVGGMPEFDFSFILVDDGSTDGTVRTAQKEAGDLLLSVISHERNFGPGYAFGTGFEHLYSKLNPEDIVITIEGDNTSRMETLGIMIGRIIRENVDVAFASPHAYGGGIVNTSFHKVLLSHASSAMTKLALSIRGIHTFTSFFRAYQGYVIMSLQKAYGRRILEFKGFECMVELTKKLVIFGFTISEVPMNLDTSMRKGKSKLKVFKTIRKYFHIFLVAKRWGLDPNRVRHYRNIEKPEKTY
jgi:dolichol-phosphate mannosyltransferase